MLVNYGMLRTRQRELNPETTIVGQDGLLMMVILKILKVLL
jgi:hypothetical protein